MSLRQLQHNLIRPKAFNSYIANYDSAPLVVSNTGGSTSTIFLSSLSVAGFERFSLYVEVSAFTGTAPDVSVSQNISNIASVYYDVIGSIPATGQYMFDFGGGSGALAYRVLNQINIYLSGGSGTTTVRYAELVMLG